MRVGRTPPMNSGRGVTIWIAAAKYRAGGSCIDRATRAQGSRTMTCREMDNVISSRSSNSPLPPEAAEHSVRCEGCRSLVRLLDATLELPEFSESQLKQIQTGIAGNLKPVRPLPPSRFFL